MLVPTLQPDIRDLEQHPSGGSLKRVALRPLERAQAESGLSNANSSE